jgi:hypothetical protein
LTNNQHHKRNKMCLPAILPPPECFADVNGAAKGSVIKKNSNKRRRLSFASEISRVVGTVLPLDEYTTKEIEKSWWSAGDQQVFSANCREVVSSVGKCGPSFVALLDDSYKAAKVLSFRLSDTAVDELLNDPREFTQKLEAWVLIGQERRGLEMSVSLLQRFERKSSASETREMVFDLEQMGASGDEIGQIYAKHCRTSRIYARMMGSADCRIPCRDGRSCPIVIAGLIRRAKRFVRFKRC